MTVVCFAAIFCSVKLFRQLIDTINMSLDLKIVKNYSHALFVSAKALSKENKILEQISMFAHLIQENSTVRNALCSPVIDRAVKVKLVDLVATKHKFEETSKQFLYALIKNARCILLPQIAGTLDELIAATNGVKSAEVSSAFKLGRKEIKFIQGFLETELGQKIELIANVNPSLIGGVIIKYDSNLIDCSVQGALDRIKKVAVKSKI